MSRSRTFTCTTTRRLPFSRLIWLGPSASVNFATDPRGTNGGRSPACSGRPSSTVSRWDSPPWGSGIGSFVPVFQQVLPESLMLPNYINAAHNDYAQVWMEGGIAGLLVAALCGLALFVALGGYLRGHAGERRLTWSALLGIFALLAHAGADYALRTPALSTVAALLAAVLIAQGARSMAASEHRTVSSTL